MYVKGASAHCALVFVGWYLLINIISQIKKMRFCTIFFTFGMKQCLLKTIFDRRIAAIYPQTVLILVITLLLLLLKT